VGVDTTDAALRVVREWPATLELSPAAIDTVAVAVAVSEALSNACTHAYPPGQPGCVEVVLSTDTFMLPLEVIDHGHWRPPLDGKLGTGLAVMSELTESVLLRFAAEAPGCCCAIDSTPTNARCWC
jgi:anti-sigma regulatory factor (Ser/Thr protein kinase)